MYVFLGGLRCVSLVFTPAHFTRLMCVDLLRPIKSTSKILSIAPFVYVIGGSVVLFGKNRVLKLAVVNKIV